MVRTRSRRHQGGGQGFNLVALLVLITVVNVVIAAALPTWSQTVKREKEAELVFRGLQYAEAIRIFQLRHGRFPTSLRELMTVNPRAIRQLWTDPFNDDGEWALILAQSPTPAGRRGAASGEERRRRRQLRNQDTTEETVPRERVTDPEGLDIPRAGQVVARGPVIGVRSLSDDEALRVFSGGTKYNEWLFTVDLIPVLAQPVLGENVPRLHTGWVGKPFPEGTQVPEAGGMPDSPERKNPLDRSRDRRRPRRPDREEG